MLKNKSRLKQLKLNLFTLKLLELNFFFFSTFIIAFELLGTSDFSGSEELSSRQMLELSVRFRKSPPIPCGDAINKKD